MNSLASKLVATKLQNDLKSEVLTIESFIIMEATAFFKKTKVAKVQNYGSNQFCYFIKIFWKLKVVFENSKIDLSLSFGLIQLLSFYCHLHDYE